MLDIILATAGMAGVKMGIQEPEFKCVSFPPARNMDPNCYECLFCCIPNRKRLYTCARLQQLRAINRCVH